MPLEHEIIETIRGNILLYCHCGESKKNLNERLVESWRRALETHDFRISRSKT